MRSIKVVHGIEFGLDAVTQKFAWLGRSGSGKTYGCKRFVEQLLRIGAQVIIIDTVGVWFGLRRGVRAFDIPVLGGLYGDIQLEESAGELVAEVAVQHASSLVLDVSHMRDAERARFAERFGRRIFELKKSRPSAMHIVLDEGQDVVPQNPANNENMMLHEWVRIAKQGRAFGIGLSIVSQRPQEVSKKALNQAECVMAFQLTGPQERKALEYWLADKGLTAKLNEVLPTLSVGEPYIWSPQWLKVARVCGKVLPIESDDTSQTPTLGQVSTAVANSLKPIDLGKLRDSMAQLASATEPKPQKCASTSDIEKLKHQLSVMHADLKKERLRVDHVNESAREFVRTFNEMAMTFLKQVEAPPPETAETSAAVDKPAASPPERQSGTPHSGDSNLPKGELAVLRVVAQSNGDCTVSRISLVTGLRGASVESYLNRLSGKGLVDRGRGLATCTVEGIKSAGDLPPKLSGKDLLKRELNTLPKGEAKVLAEVMSSKSSISRDDIAKSTGLSAASVESYLNRLATRKLVLRDKGKACINREVYA